MTQVEKLKTELASLPLEEREVLVDFLLTTLPTDEASEREWEAELSRRDLELETGAVPEIPAEEV
jgi:hypothetical protein